MNLRQFFLACVMIFACFQQGFAKPKYPLDSLLQLVPLQVDTALALTLLRVADHYFFDAEQVDSCEVYAEKALKISETLRHPRLLSHVWYFKGLVHRSKLEFLKGIHAYEKSIQYSIDYGAADKVSVCYHNIGNIYLAMLDEESALEYFLKSVEVALKSGNEKKLQGVYSSIGVLYGRLDQFDKAKHYQKQSFDLAQKYQDIRGIIFSSNNLAAHYVDTDSLDLAMYYAHTTLDVGRKNNFRSGVLMGNHQLTRICRLQGKWTQALAHADDFIKIADPNSKEEAAKIAGTYRQKALIYDTLGYRNKSWEMMELAMKQARFSESGLSLASVYQNWSDLSRKQGDYETALRYTKQFYHVKDSLYGDEKRVEIQRLQEEFQTEQQERQLESLAQATELQALRIRKRTTWLIFASILAALGMLIGFLFHRHRLLSQQQDSIEARQEALRSQLNPHFLFHALSAIQEVIDQEQDSPKAARYLAKFAKLMRLILENSREAFILLDQEIRTLTLFLDLQQVRFLHRFTYEIELEDSLDLYTLKVPPMLAQPILEDLLKKVLTDSTMTTDVRISFSEYSGQLKMKVEMSANAESIVKYSDSRISQSIMDERLTLLKKQFGEAPRISIQEHKQIKAPHLYTVELLFPLLDNIE